MHLIDIYMAVSPLPFFSECDVSDILPGLQCLPGLICLLWGKALGNTIGQRGFAITVTVMKLETAAGDMFPGLFRSEDGFFAV
ncbi:hypothetical protein NM213_00695 [Pseudomonas lactis]|nr:MULTISPECIES: hypothetical protein [Pseudomonas]MDR8368434.1 hypothetical protein [Pseudomonas lactis]GLH49008.1 hypothetical protein RS3R2_26940 [Pseudomonas lactis]